MNWKLHGKYLMWSFIFPIKNIKTLCLNHNQFSILFLTFIYVGIGLSEVYLNSPIIFHNHDYLPIFLFGIGIVIKLYLLPYLLYIQSRRMLFTINYKQIWFITYSIHCFLYVCNMILTLMIEKIPYEFVSWIQYGIYLLNLSAVTYMVDKIIRIPIKHVFWILFWAGLAFWLVLAIPTGIKI